MFLDKPSAPSCLPGLTSAGPSVNEFGTRWAWLKKHQMPRYYVYQAIQWLPSALERDVDEATV